MNEMQQEQGEYGGVRSSVKINRNSKGDAQFDVRVVEGAEEAELNRLRTIAVDQYKTLTAEFYPGLA